MLLFAALTLLLTVGHGLGRPHLAEKFRDAGVRGRRRQRPGSSFCRQACQLSSRTTLRGSASRSCPMGTIPGRWPNSSTTQADLAVLRTDAKVPPRARALAVLEHDVVLLISPAGKKIKSLADLRKRKIAVLANGDSNAAFVRNLLEIADVPDAASRVQMAPLNSTLDKLLASGGYGAVIVIAHASTIAKDKIYEQYAGRGSFTLNSIDESKALTRRNPAVSEETLPTGMLSSSPVVPDDDLDTIGLQWLLVVQSRMSSSTAGDLARIDLRKQGRARPRQWLRLEDRTGGYRQGRLHRRAPGRCGIYQRRHQVVHGSLQRRRCIWVSPRSASSARSLPRSTPRSPASRRRKPASSRPPFSISASGWSTPIRWTRSKQLQANWRISFAAPSSACATAPSRSDGLDTFRLGYELVRDEIGMHRDHLERHAGRDDNVVIVKTAHSG